MKTVDINSDLGESFGTYTTGNDEEVLRHISSANIACGYHSGDHNVMMKTVRIAKNLDVGIGAHPGLQDLHGFGRREIAVSPDEVYNLVIYQIGALKGIAEAQNAAMNHVKPHGALYNMAARDSQLADAVASAVYDVDPALILYGLAGSKLIEYGKKRGLTTASEVFADRTYQADGSLTPRTSPDALINDSSEAIDRVIRMITEHRVAALTGEDIEINPDTVCIHGDSPKALEFAAKLKERLIAENIRVASVKGVPGRA
ncbi:LamB/YcsF family protein [Bacillus marinisedimentorum]|uniref:LamB/YcsF family protein n=1 Tax=Bacillus marinisedimentorum TaxID=1821260 RepID=UPI0007DF203F|nr:5-oxoprolinase subunit PxpA [Bacillus marinisedimentorum]